jgi:hypothetical protein
MAISKSKSTGTVRKPVRAAKSSVKSSGPAQPKPKAEPAAAATKPVSTKPPATSKQEAVLAMLRQNFSRYPKSSVLCGIPCGQKAELTPL